MKSRILAHRGIWNQEFGIQLLEKNSIRAITRAQQFGFGLEVDIRDIGDEIKICHDAFSFSEVKIQDVAKLEFNGLVAYNVKSDGLSDKLTTLKFKQDYFFFDCSVPEALIYKEKGLHVADRLSEVESPIASLSSYVWVDSFTFEWWRNENFYKLLNENLDRRFVLVSPELHGREFLTNIQPYLDLLFTYRNTYLCTDWPLTVVNMLS